MWRKKNTPPLLVGLKVLQPLWKSVLWFLRKLGMTLPEDPAIPLLGIYPEDSLACNKDTCPTMFIAALFITAQKLEQTHMSLNGGMDTENVYIYTMSYYSATKNNEFMKCLANGWNWKISS